jgi:glyoxylase-like metal-dependent hydrolase (beta-lactamase superfamily II)
VATADGLIPIAGDSALALSNSYEIDGRISWHAPGVRGFAPLNCYLFVEDSQALLVDTGLAVHEAATLGQLGEALRRPRELSIVSLRQGEFDSMCNLVPVARDFGVETLYGPFGDLLDWTAFSPAQDADIARLRPKVRSVLVSRDDTIALGDQGRVVRILKPALRLFSTIWAIDEGTGTLCSSDVFSHVTRPTADGPWVVDAESDTTTYEDVRDHLLGTRFWWIPQADVDDMRRDLADMFDRHEINCIAPAWGCILKGPEVVARHYELVDRVLQLEGRSRKGGVRG